VWDIIQVFIWDNSFEEISPLWENHLGSGACLCITKGRRLEKIFLCCCFDDKLTLGVYSNYLVVLREEPSPILTYFSFGALGERLVVGFLGGILPATIT
jgi:hypothetical protein